MPENVVNTGETAGRLKDPGAFWTGAGFLTAALVAVVIMNRTGTSAFDWAPDCIFHKVTGLYCLGCGGTRSMNALAHGNLQAAISFNVLAVVIFVPLYVGWAINLMVYGVRGRYVFRWQPSWLQIALMVIAAIAFMIMRNLPFAPFTLLAP